VLGAIVGVAGQGTTEEVVATATVFAIVVTKSVDMIRNMFDTSPPRVPKQVWNALALGLGIATALIWRINILDNYSSPTSFVQGVSGQILTGLAIGATASGYHELFDALSSGAKKLNPVGRSGPPAKPPGP
jgi:flagellar biosynthesis protein FliR